MACDQPQYHHGGCLSDIRRDKGKEKRWLLRVRIHRPASRTSTVFVVRLTDYLSFVSALRLIDFSIKARLLFHFFHPPHTFCDEFSSVQTVRWGSPLEVNSGYPETI